MRIFSGHSLRATTEGQLAALQREVASESKNRLLNVNEDEYVEYLAEKYSIEPVVFDWDAVHVSDREVQIPAERFPGSFNVYSGRSTTARVRAGV